MINRRGEARGVEVRLVKMAGTKHEIFNADDAVLTDYWEKVFAFLMRK